MNVSGLFKIEFYGQGEAGGLIGMIMGNTKIANCHVSNSTMDCYGEDNFKLNAGLAKVDIAGRHVNHFIGNVRTVGGSKTSINNCTAINNTYITSDGKRKDTHSKVENATDLIGEAYFLYYQKISFPSFKYTTVYYDTKGSVTVNDKEVLPNV